MTPMRSSSQQLLGVPEGSGHLYLRIYHRIRSLILTGAWPVGTRLPSSRSLARDLGISRNTALLAIDKLIADGWIVTRPGSGIYVSMETPPVRPTPTETQPADYRLSRGPVAFEIAHAAADTFPIKAWSKIHGQVWSEAAEDALHEGSGAGWMPLRIQISNYLHAVRGLVCSPEQVIVVSSTQAAIDLSMRVLSNSGDQIWIEDPGYPYAREAFLAHGLVQCPVPVDRDGISVEVGLSRAPRARFAYVTPACQFPTCAVLSSARRFELLNWVSRSASYIIEDDWDFNAVFDGSFPVEPMAALDPERVIFIHAFNRILFPALRVAALVVPPSLVGRFVDARRAIDGFPNVANQIALAEFMNNGLLSSHLRRCRSVYETRRAELYASIEMYLSEWLALEPQATGLHLLASTRGLSDSAVAAAARQGGVACVGVSDFILEEYDRSHAVILGFGAFRESTIRESAERLAAVFSAVGTSRRDGS